MRARELIEALAKVDPDDVVGIGVYTGQDCYTSTAIAEIKQGKGILLLYTPKNADFIPQGGMMREVDCHDWQQATEARQ